MDCIPSPLFQLTEYHLPTDLEWIFKIVSICQRLRVEI